MKFISPLLLVFILLISCKDAKPVAKLDLLKYGLPISVTAPENAVVDADDMGVMHDVTIKAGEDYYIQIYGSDAVSVDAKAIFQKKKADIKKGPFFTEISMEEENGMIYKKNIDENTIDYDFIYVKIQGDKEFIFQTGLIGMFNEEQVTEMYNSVK